MLATDKHSNLLRNFVNYVQEKFYNSWPWCQCYKTFYILNLLTFVII
jgi:hypothetical protein